MTNAASGPVVRLSNVVKTYKAGALEVPAVKGISIEIPRQRFSMIVGPSGSGKTTLLNLIGCIDKPTSGTVVVAELDTATMSDNQISDFRAQRVGFIFQNITVNLAHDYTTTIGGEETLQDADRKNRECWRLDMKAATPDAIYNRIEYWVERGTYYPIKGKFYSDSGRLLKIAYYHKYEEQLGALRPTEVILIDAVNANLATTIDYAGYRFQEIPETWFQRDYLPRLKPE